MELMTKEKKNFKRTDIGLIPVDWEVVQLGDIINYTKGFAFKSAEYSDSGVRIVRVSDVKKGEIKKDGGVFIPHAHSIKYSSWSLNADDIIVSTVGSKPPLYESIVGKPYLVKESESGYLLNQNAVKLRVNNDFKYSQDLLYHHFEVRRYYEHIEEIFRGNANQASITLESLFKYKIPLPPTLAEQTAIASALSDVDELIRSLDGLIQKKQAIKKGAMQQFLSGKKRLPGFAGEWEVKRLGDLFEITSSKRVFQSEWKKKGIPFYRARELAVLGEKGHVDNDLFIDRDLYETHKRSYGVPQKGDLLVTGVGTLGKVYLVPDEEEFYFKDGNIIWYKINGKVNSEFLKQLYSTPLIIDQIKESSAGSTVGTYTITAANNTKIPFPSLEEQKAIAQILSDMDRELQTLRQKREKYVQVKQGMMQELLTGRTRLV